MMRVGSWGEDGEMMTPEEMYEMGVKAITAHKEINGEEEVVVTSCGAKTSPSPRLDLIPFGALVRVARRYEKGLERYGEGNWRRGLGDPSYVVERLCHTITHCWRLIEKIKAGRGGEGDDDAAAIVWGGMLACEATPRRDDDSTH